MLDIIVDNASVSKNLIQDSPRQSDFEIALDRSEPERISINSVNINDSQHSIKLDEEIN